MAGGEFLNYIQHRTPVRPIHKGSALATERRQQKVAEFIRKEAALVIRELNDPRVGFITITEVDCTSDLRQAKIYYSVFGSEADKRTTTRALAHAKGFLRKKTRCSTCNSWSYRKSQRD